MRSEHFAKFAAAREALLAVEVEHPESASLPALHGALWGLVKAWSQLFNDDQVVILGGGTNKQ